MSLRFIKMHGLGNDFLIAFLEAGTEQEPSWVKVADNPEMIRKLADRRLGIGFDQLVLIDPGEIPDGKPRVVFFNSDGSATVACGNGTRCAARLLLDRRGRDELHLASDAGDISAKRSETGISLFYPPYSLVPHALPVTLTPPHEDVRCIDLTRYIPGLAPELGPATLVSVGNPHCVFFVENVDQPIMPPSEVTPSVVLDMNSHHHHGTELAITPKTLHWTEYWGRMIECSSIFPEGTNVEFAQVLTDGTNGTNGAVRQITWERGAGLTPACGTGAMAVRVAAHLRGLSGRAGPILLEGGELFVKVFEPSDTHDRGGIMLAGPATYAYEGMWKEQWNGGEPI